MDIATPYLEEDAMWGSSFPINPVRECLSNEVNFDPLTATLLVLHDELAHTELSTELASRIVLMVSLGAQVMNATQVSLGLVVTNLTDRSNPPKQAVAVSVPICMTPN